MTRRPLFAAVVFAALPALAGGTLDGRSVTLNVMAWHDRRRPDV